MDVFGNPKLHRWIGRPVWWFLILRKGTDGSVPIIVESLSLAFLARQLFENPSKGSSVGFFEGGNTVDLLFIL